MRRDARRQCLQRCLSQSRCPPEQAARAPRWCGGGPAPGVPRGQLAPAAEVTRAGGGGGVARRLGRERLRLGCARPVVPGLRAEEVVGDADHALLAQRACRAACWDSSGSEQPARGSARTVLLAHCRAVACSRLWITVVGRFQTLSTPIPHRGCQALRKAGAPPYLSATSGVSVHRAAPLLIVNSLAHSSGNGPLGRGHASASWNTLPAPNAAACAGLRLWRPCTGSAAARTDQLLQGSMCAAWHFTTPPQCLATFGRQRRSAGVSNGERGVAEVC